MSLDGLKNVKKIDGFSVVVMDYLRSRYPAKFNLDGSMNWSWFEKELRPNNFIYIREDKNSLSFTLQNGPVKEVGVNGCQPETIIEAARLILQGMDKQYPCNENKRAIGHLYMAVQDLKDRKKDRKKRGVEGFREL